MAANNPTERICCVCRIKQPISGMTRIVKIKSQNGAATFAVDKNHKLNGRGCHVCPSCIVKAVKTKALNRSFKCPVPETVYKDLSDTGNPC